MKGKLKHKEGKWFVEYFVKHEFLDVHLDKTEEKELPLHPDSLLSPLTINNGLYGMEKDVEFEIIDIVEMKCCYAKLIQPNSKTPMLDSLAKAIREMPNKFEDDLKTKEETWDDIINTYALTTGLIPGFTKPNFINRKMLIEWLKEHYFSPKKK